MSADREGKILLKLATTLSCLFLMLRAMHHSRLFWIQEQLRSYFHALIDYWYSHLLCAFFGNTRMKKVFHFICGFVESRVDDERLAAHGWWLGIRKTRGTVELGITVGISVYMFSLQLKCHMKNNYRRKRRRIYKSFHNMRAIRKGYLCRNVRWQPKRIPARTDLCHVGSTSKKRSEDQTIKQPFWVWKIPHNTVEVDPAPTYTLQFTYASWRINSLLLFSWVVSLPFVQCPMLADCLLIDRSTQRFFLFVWSPYQSLHPAGH